VPTPGVPGSQGGRNGVFALAKGEIQTLSLGEPEPNDVVRTLDGTVYWTCTSAGVILQRSPQGTVSLLLGGLDHPLGITADRAGNLYFTEVPTPGIPGSMGGRNKVWRYNVHTGRKTLVDEGDPEPRDVAATVKGTLYWTCSSAGVIVRATPDRGGK
jgi:streptogramin lyase